MRLVVQAEYKLTLCFICILTIITVMRYAFSVPYQIP
jgi:hypothetical protein